MAILLALPVSNFKKVDRNALCSLFPLYRKNKLFPLKRKNLDKKKEDSTMKNVLRELRIRNVDMIAVAKLDQLANEKGMSRTGYTKYILEKAVFSEEMKKQENDYQELVNVILEVVKENTELLREFKMMMEENNG